ncbi:hypothetical protein KW790_02330 [Candidatus Parcubacteria bacterium]|nr:hypothetical protein [Candidatus Parcubacteria bacterium]
MNYSLMKKSALILLVVVFFGWGLSIIGGRFFFKSSPDTDVSGILSEVGKTILLPEDESPTIATVVDPRELRGSLFSDSRVGDKLIFYSGTAQAILYRPSEKRIIAVGTLSINDVNN